LPHQKCYHPVTDSSHGRYEDDTHGPTRTARRSAQAVLARWRKERHAFSMSLFVTTVPSQVCACPAERSLLAPQGDRPSAETYLHAGGHQCIGCDLEGLRPHRVAASASLCARDGPDPGEPRHLTVDTRDPRAGAHDEPGDHGSTLEAARRALVPHGRSTTKPGTLLKKSIPFAPGRLGRCQAGFLEIDLVAHCAESTEGDYWPH